MIKRINLLYKRIGQYVGALVYAPSTTQGSVICLAAAIGLLHLGMPEALLAQGIPDNYKINVDTSQMEEVIHAVFAMLDGAFGALIMVGAGIGAIVSSAFGQYRTSLGLFVVAIGSFVLQSLVTTFFDFDTQR